MSKRFALIGLDGSGKSTNIDKMKLDLDYSQFEFVWVRWKPFLLKPLYLFMDRKVSKISGEKESKMKEELNSRYHTKSGLKKRIFRNPVIRGAWMTLAIIDYFIQFYIKVFPVIVSGGNIIFDRFFLDLFVDQGISFGYSPAKIGKLIRRFGCLFPCIDKYVYINVSVETCYNRKEDIPNLDYLNDRFNIYEHLSKGNNWVIVDGEMPLDEVYKHIKQVILEK